MNIGSQILIALASGMVSSIFLSGGFYYLTNWRIKQLENHNNENKDIRDRLIKIESSQEQILNLFKNSLHEKDI